METYTQGNGMIGDMDREKLDIQMEQGILDNGMKMKETDKEFYTTQKIKYSTLVIGRMICVSI